ncbi:hypothetical protein FIBSPDRAFT_673666, partial [Athelia psychrophila]
WAANHHATFEVDKFALVQFSRAKRKNPATGRREELPGPNLVPGDVTIVPKDAAKLLGVYMDRKLIWNVQAAAAKAKGLKYMMAAKRLSLGKWGVPGRLGVQLYSGLVVP